MEQVQYQIRKKEEKPAAERLSNIVTVAEYKKLQNKNPGHRLLAYAAIYDDVIVASEDLWALYKLPVSTPEDVIVTKYWQELRAENARLGIN